MFLKECLCWCCGIIIVALIYHFWSQFMEYVMYHQQSVVDGYFVNSNSCRTLTILPHNHDTNQMWRDVSKDLCVGYQPIVFGTSDPLNNYLSTQISKGSLLKVLNVSSTSMFCCKYHFFERWTDYTNRRIDSKTLEIAKHVKLHINAHIVHTECKLNQSIVHDKVHCFLRRSQSIKKVSFLPLGALEKSERLSVMIIGLDSVSHMHFLRSMSRTFNFINTLSHVEFMGFNRVGGNSFKSLVPLLSGLSSGDLKTACFDLKGFDSCRFIWQSFKDAGYKTCLGEDGIDFGLFTVNKSGFYRQPTDYYLRPSFLQMWKRREGGINHRTHCNGMDSSHKILRDFAYRLVPYLRQDNFFTFLWWTQGGKHSIYNYARKLDSIIVEMFEYLLMEGIFDKTVLVLMSPNGLATESIHNTQQGMLKENQPVLFICYPKWLKNKYPLAIKNLEMNDKTLITAYDLHATLLDLSNNPKTLNDDQVRYRNEKLTLLSVVGDDGAYLPGGISLFLSIPERNCELVNISPKFCNCYTQSMARFSEKRVVQAAQLLLRTINDMLKPQIPPCNHLSISRVVNVHIWDRQNEPKQFDVVVQVETLPGCAQFKGIMRYNGYSMALNGPILRCNQMRNNSRCVRNYLIEMFCHCY